MKMQGIADSARLIGAFHLGDNVRVSQGSVLRSRDGAVTIGHGSMILENSVVVGTPEEPVSIGRKTVFGHKCICLGAQIGDLCEVGNGTIFLPGSRVGDWCIFGEGTIIAAGAVIPDESVVVGRPGRVIRSLTDADRAMIERMRGGNAKVKDAAVGSFTFEPKENEGMGKLYPHGNKYPTIDETTYVFDSAEINGDVQIGKDSIIASGVKIIGDSHGPVRIGNNVQILENTVLHLLPDNELVIGDGVTIGPGCIIHGTTIGEGTVVEAGAIVCDYSRVGSNARIMAGSLVKQRAFVADNSIVEGFPAKEVGVNTAVQQRPIWALKAEEQGK